MTARERKALGWTIGLVAGVGGLIALTALLPSSQLGAPTPEEIAWANAHRVPPREEIAHAQMGVERQAQEAQAKPLSYIEDLRQSYRDLAVPTSSPLYDEAPRLIRAYGYDCPQADLIGAECLAQCLHIIGVLVRIVGG